MGLEKVIYPNFIHGQQTCVNLKLTFDVQVQHKYGTMTYFCTLSLQHTCVTITYFCTYAAYMCHHNTFLIHGSLENPTHQRWSLVTHLSIGFSMTLMLILGILGYVSFTGHTQGKTLKSLSLVTVYSFKIFHSSSFLSQTL